MGETTFGKGLVQRVIPLQDGGALAVTTAKYYTPSGRLIQRDYSDLEAYYLNNAPADDSDEGIGDGRDPELPETEREVYRTSSGRKVYGGGGITPDYEVETSRASELLSRLRRENLVFDYSVRFIADHPDVEPGFEIDDKALEAFRAFLSKRDVEIDAEEFGADHNNIALALRAQIARIKWGQAEESRIIAAADEQVQRALELFDEAESLSRRAARTGVSDGSGVEIK